ncbi:rNA polymerase sigma-70 factor ECF subfamily protein [Candidatus Apopatosoma intestinale]|nr:rNA polymerase sigma-70 factor ECF subfamily protein [Candidatus Apopatosoma intestinale]
MNNHFDKTDEALVELTLLGDETAYEELVTRHQRAVMGTAYKVTKNRFSAEDASQDAFVSAWMNLCELRDASKFGAWVCSFAKNCARTLERHYRAAIPDISLDTLEGFEIAEEDEPFAEDDLENVRRSVDLLSEKIRETVRLHYFEGKSVAEIAKILSVPVGTVKWRLSEGRKQLRKGYGIMEKTYDENESLVARVMRQVEALKLWQLKNDKTGFEEEYRAVLANVEALEDSKEKSSMLADTLLRGYWWLPGEKNKEVFERIKKSAEDGHNDDVMMTVAYMEHEKYSGEERIRFMRETQIPYYREGGYPKTLAYIWFWLGYEYRKKGEYEEAIRCYEQVMNILTPSDVYYANAKSAIEGEKRSIAAEKNPEVIRYNPDVSGEVYKKIDGKLYLWQLPGYGYCADSAERALFWNMSLCDGLMLDESMKTGDTVTSSDEKITLTYLKNDGACDTPAGHFENCSVYIIDGERYGLTHCETWLCDGIGIVRQIVTRHDDSYEWVLSSYKTSDKGGLLPFETGNRWEYALAEREATGITERENIFEVTACDAGSVTLSSMNFMAVTGYYDTWEGKTAEARYCYCKNITSDDEILCDVSGAMKRAEELAVTKRQKLHTAIANKVMRRIFETDPAENPNYTEKGRWNFFEYDAIKKADGKISCDDLRKYSFEWKDMSDCGRKCVGYKVLYSFFFSILQDAAGCLWSDKWQDGYHFDERKSGKYVTKNFNVKGGETVVTPAGTFENCLRVSFDFQAWGYFSGRSEYLFADGVGIVRFEHPYGEDKCAVWELTEYKGTGKGFFPTDDGLFRRYEADALSDGWHGSVEYTFDEDETGTVMFKNALGNQDRADYEKMKKK